MWMIWLTEFFLSNRIRQSSNEDESRGFLGKLISVGLFTSRAPKRIINVSQIFPQCLRAAQRNGRSERADTFEANELLSTATWWEQARWSLSWSTLYDSVTFILSTHDW